MKNKKRKNCTLESIGKIIGKKKISLHQLDLLKGGDGEFIVIVDDIDM